MSYIDPSPTSKLGRIRVVLFDLLQEHDASDTIPTSARFLFYELVARGVIPKEKVDSRSPAHIVHTALTDLRQSGAVDWEWIVDETRRLEDLTGAASVRAWVMDALKQARLDPWGGEAPLVITESRSLAGALRRTCDRYCVRLVSTNGQVGGFLHTDVIPVLSGGDRVLYFGDWDLCGDDIEANTRSVLEEEVGELKWERLALTEAQVRQHRLPTIVKNDRRFSGRGGVHEAVETEALSQSLIVGILEHRLVELLPEPLEDVLRREAEERLQIERLLNRGRR